MNSNRKILVVEDEFLIANYIKNILEGEGYEVFVDFSTFDESVNAINEIQPDLVLIDINIKGDKDGIDIGKFLLKQDSVPFVFISSHTDNITFERVKESRPHSFIVKPFNDIVLKTTVQLVLNNYRHKNVDPLRYSEEEPQSEIPFKIRKAIEYINDNILDKIEIDQLARITNWKKHHFIRQFYKQVGLTPYQYILKRKIIKSIAMIQETNLPLLDISFEVGFSSYTNFYKSFKKITSQTPENFRKQNFISNNQRFH